MGRDTDSNDEKMHFQVERFHCQNGEWYYTTREGEERGPFESKEDAEGDLTAFIRHQVNMKSFGL